MLFGKRNPPPPDPSRNVIRDTVPRGMIIAGAWSWRFLAIAGALAVFVFLIIQLKYIVIPFLIAILLGALLVPFVQFLQRKGWPKWLAALLALLGTLAVIVGLVYLIVSQIRRGFADLQEKSLQAFEAFKDSLLASPFEITEEQVNEYIAGLTDSIQADGSGLWAGALSVGSTAGHVLAGALLVIFATIFVVIDGRGIWNWVVRLFPRRARAAVDGAGSAGWETLTTFARVQVFVAAVDAIGIGLGAWILGLFYGGFPLVIPIAIAVFLGSFVPIVGALVTGTLAIFVALIYLGPVPAIIMLGIVLLVQQVEGHVLQPLVMGVAVKVHPLAVVFAVAAGSFIAGIAGALFAVPIVAVLNVMVKYLANGAWRTRTAGEPVPVGDYG